MARARARSFVCVSAHALPAAVVHSDVSSRHCLIANDASGVTLKLSDFGTTRRLFAPESSRQRRRRRLANYSGGSMASDVCGAGVILHELWTGHVPTSVELAVLQQRTVSMQQRDRANSTGVVRSAAASCFRVRLNFCRHALNKYGARRPAKDTRRRCVEARHRCCRRSKRRNTRSRPRLRLKQRMSRSAAIAARAPSSDALLRATIATT